MRMTKKYLTPLLLYFVVYLFALLITGMTQGAVKLLYTALSDAFPAVFPDYNPIRHPEKYEALTKVHSFIAIAIELLIINLIALRLDNPKYEEITGRTDGQYTIREGLRLYLSLFTASDVISSVLLPTVLTLAAYFIPTELLSYGLNIPLWMGVTLSGIADPFGAIIFVVAASVLTRALAIIYTVRVYRGMWLIGTIGG